MSFSVKKREFFGGKNEKYGEKKSWRRNSKKSFKADVRTGRRQHDQQLKKSYNESRSLTNQFYKTRYISVSCVLCTAREIPKNGILCAEKKEREPPLKWRRPRSSINKHKIDLLAKSKTVVCRFRILTNATILRVYNVYYKFGACICNTGEFVRAIKPFSKTTKKEIIMR